MIINCLCSRREHDMVLSSRDLVLNFDCFGLGSGGEVYILMWLVMFLFLLVMGRKSILRVCIMYSFVSTQIF